METLSPGKRPHRPTDTSRLVLGAAQLGMEYGIANKTGRPDSDLAKKIVKTAWESGIKIYDTAQEYGESEIVLGNAMQLLGLCSEPRVITKLDPNLDHLDKYALERAIRRSLDRLHIPTLHGLMLHREEYLELWERGLGDILRGFITRGLTEYIGASVYSPKKAALALGTDGIDMIQIPSNIFDRRFEQAGVFELAQRRGKEIYVRSVFLQGLILMNTDELPERMQFAVEVLNKLEDLSRETGLSKQDLSLNYVRKAFPEANIVIGVETSEQIRNNLKSWKRAFPVELVEQVQEDFLNVEERILNPSLWPN